MVEPAEIDALVERARVAIAAAGSTEEIREVAAEVAGKKSALARAGRQLGSLEPEARKQLGRALHEARATVDALLESRRAEIAATELAREMAEGRIDLTEFLPGSVAPPLTRGHLNLVTRTQTALEDVFVGMGFEVAEGPEIETDWYNFEALNIPPAHPARGMWDTFYLDLGEPETILLRTHTSPVQIHLMEQAVAEDLLPIHAVMPGRCYRRDTPDARHLPVFHQIEGLVVDRGITFADLAGTIEVFTDGLLRPGHPLPPAPGLLPLHRAVGRVRGHLHHLPRRGLPDLLADRLDRARRLRHGRPRRLRRRGHRSRRAGPGSPSASASTGCAQMRHADRRHAGPDRERHPLPASVLMWCDRGLTRAA